MAFPKPNNALAAMAQPAAKAQAPAAAPAAQRFSGVGAKVQGRPGQSLDQLASRMHPGAK